MRRNRNKTTYILVSILVALILATLGAFGVLEPVKGAFLAVGGGIVSVVRWPFDRVYDFVVVIGSIGHLKTDKVSLMDEVESLKAKNSKLTEENEELGDLREQFEFRQTFKSETIEANVVGRTADESRQIIIIGRGSSGDVEENDAVLTPSGSLVGVVKKVYPMTAEVVLITDPGSTINAKIQKIENGLGLVRGEHGVSLTMEAIDKSAEVKDGQVVVTSGLDGMLPNGLVVGMLSHIIDAESDLFKSARVNPVVSFRNLTRVFILKKVN